MNNKKNVLKSFTLALSAYSAGFATAVYIAYKCYLKIEKRYNKNLFLRNFYEKWTLGKERGKTPEGCLLEKDIHSVAIYGLGNIGKMLYKELESSAVDVKYLVDQHAAELNYDLPVYTIRKNLPYVDAVIVTAFGFDDIKKELLNAGVKMMVISVDEVMNEMLL